MKRVTPEVERMLAALGEAHAAFNMAGTAYAGDHYDSPYRLLVELIKRTVQVAAPEISADRVYREFVDSGESLTDVICNVAEDTTAFEADVLAMLHGMAGVSEVEVQRHRTRSTGEFNAAPHFMAYLSGGGRVSIIPDDGQPDWWLTYRQWEALAYDRHGDHVVLPGSSDAANRGVGLDHLRELMIEVISLDA